MYKGYKVEINKDVKEFDCLHEYSDNALKLDIYSPYFYYLGVKDGKYSKELFIEKLKEHIKYKIDGYCMSDNCPDDCECDDCPIKDNCPNDIYSEDDTHYHTTSLEEFKKQLAETKKEFESYDFAEILAEFK